MWRESVEVERVEIVDQAFVLGGQGKKNVNGPLLEVGQVKAHGPIYLAYK